MSSVELIHYNAARRALAQAVKIDDVKDIRDKSLAMELYAYQRRDRELMAWSTELKRRAGRRLGQVMAELRTEKKLAKGARQKGVGKRGNAGLPETRVESLAEQGIDKNLANEARKLAAMSEEKFEADVAKAVAVAVASVDGNKEVIAAARAESQRQKQESRAAKEQALGERTIAASQALGTSLYGVIYADPPWRFEPYSRDTGMDRAADNHYPTMTLDDIKAMAVPAAEDCVLFLWATVPMLPQALEVMTAWGFTYKSHFAWVKAKAGTGYWNRNRHELLLIGTRGNIPAPAPGTQYESVIEASSPRHSVKPFHFREIIEETFPTAARVELFARERFDGWDSWGNEVSDVAA